MKQKRTYKNYIMPLVLSILILGVMSVFATNYINENYVTSVNGNLSNLNVSNISLTSNGNLTFYDGQTYRGVSSGTADVVVCKSNSIYNDVYMSNKIFSGCDLACKTTDSDTVCASKLQSSVETPNRYVIWKGSFYINTPIILSSNIILDGLGQATLLANGTEDIWTNGLGGGLRGIFTDRNPAITGGYINNVILKGFIFNINGNANAISLFSFDDVTIEYNEFTGNSTASGGGAINVNMHFSDSNSSILDIEHNYFHDYLTKRTSGLVNIHSYDGKIVDDIYIFKNDFFRYMDNAIYLGTTESGFITNVEINNNHFNEINSSSTPVDGFASAVFGGINGQNTLLHLKIIENTFKNGYNGFPSSPNSAFAFLYGVNDTIISNNIIDYNTNLPDYNCPLFIVPGRTTNPMDGLIVSNNIINGMGFWDPDSMRNVEVYGNIQTDSCAVPISLGYGIQENVHIHDNIIVNYKNSYFGNPHLWNATILLGASDPNNCVIENNYIYDYSASSNLKIGLKTTGHNYANVTIRNNNLYIKNGAITNKTVSGSDVLPSVIDNNNFLNSNRNYNTSGNGTFSYLFGNSICLDGDACLHSIKYNGSCIVAVGTGQTGNCI